MKIYSSYGFNEFIILLGYKGYYIKEYFANYYLHQSDVTIDMTDNSLHVHNSYSEPWKVTLIDTGLNTMTGGRIKRAKKYINNEPFMLTYGDGVADINITELLDFHRSHGNMLTATSVQPAGRYGALNIKNHGKVSSFKEKPKGDGDWINGGFFICEPASIDYIDGDTTGWEREPLENIARDGEIYTYKHNGFWQCMDTLRDCNMLIDLWETGKAPWKVWHDSIR